MPSIGPIPLAHPLCQAGLAGYSDRAMRHVAKRQHLKQLYQRQV